MQEVRYIIDGKEIRGFVYWRHNTIPPHVEGLTYERAVVLAAEAEAKNKWCPFARVASVDVDDKSSWNRLGGAEESIPNESMCIGSLCMAWRWVYGNPADSESKGGITLPKELWPGYCGMMQRVTPNEFHT